MTLRRWGLVLGAAATVVLVGLAAAWAAGLLSLTVRITLDQAAIDRELARLFPVVRRHLDLVTVTYDHPRAVILSDGRVRIGIDAVTTVKGIALRGSVAAVGRVLYDPASGGFFLTELVAERIALPGLPTVVEERLVHHAGPAIAAVLTSHPVHRLARDDPKRWLLRSVTVEDQRLVLLLGR